MSKTPVQMDDPEGEFAALIASTQLSPIAMIITDARLPDAPIMAVNQAFTKLTGYLPEEVVGRTCQFLAGPLTEPSARAVLRQAIEQGKPALVKLTSYRKDGSTFCNALMLAPVHDASGKVALFVGSQVVVEPSEPLNLDNDAKSIVASLSPRQRQVLKLMVAGHRNKQIAHRLGIDDKTVKFHRALLLKRLGARSSAEAVRIGVQAGMCAD